MPITYGSSAAWLGHSPCPCDLQVDSVVSQKRRFHATIIRPLFQLIPYCFSQASSISRSFSHSHPPILAIASDEPAFNLRQPSAPYPNKWRSSYHGSRSVVISTSSHMMGLIRNPCGASLPIITLEITASTLMLFARLCVSLRGSTSVGDMPQEAKHSLFAVVLSSATSSCFLKPKLETLRFSEAS